MFATRCLLRLALLLCCALLTQTAAAAQQAAPPRAAVRDYLLVPPAAAHPSPPHSGAHHSLSYACAVALLQDPLYGWEVVEKQNITELGAQGTLYRHTRTGESSWQPRGGTLVGEQNAKVGP